MIVDDLAEQYPWVRRAIEGAHIIRVPFPVSRIALLGPVGEDVVVTYQETADPVPRALVRGNALYLGEMEQATNEVQPVGRWGYHPTKKDEKRFWGQVDRTTTPDGCWEFTGTRNKGGYGKFSVGGRNRLAHHVALELVGFIIPAEFLQVRHLCHNRPCCRPSHLKIGTPQEDADDKVFAGRQAFLQGERNGNAKLRQQDVDEIRRLYADGGVSQRALARQFGVSPMTIADILSGKTWNASTVSPDLPGDAQTPEEGS